MKNIFRHNLDRARRYAGLIRQTSTQVDKIRAATQELNNRVDSLHNRVDSLHNRVDGIPGVQQRTPEETDITKKSSDVVNTLSSPYDVLEGTPYSRYALPIEYLPSRDFSPRWGEKRPREPILNGWFEAHADDYHAFLKNMPESAQKLKDIPLQFDETLLPTPAWGGVPYAPFDSVALYTMVQTHKPKRYLEIGSGITTCFAYRAIKDAGLKTRITSIDPEPRAKIDAICDDIIRDGLETCDLSIFDELGSKPIDTIDLAQQIRFKASNQQFGGFDGALVLVVG